MANSNSTYQTQRLSFVGTPQQRSPTTPEKDLRLVNCFVETTKGPEGTSRAALVQRAGLQFQHHTGLAEGRGIYYYDGYTFSVSGGDLYQDDTIIQTLSTSTGPVGFIEYAGLLPYLIVLDGISGWVVTSAGVVVQITDVDFPSPHCTQGAYLDGYLFIAQADTADIYNSALDDPYSWTAGNFITAEMYPDLVVAVIRQNNYVVAFGEQTIEYFYNAGTATGTPLARNPAAFQQIGAAATRTVVQSEGQLLFVGQTASGGKTVWAMDGFKPTEIGIVALRNALSAEGTSIVNAQAFCIRSKGHRFYVLSLSTKTWVFDIGEGMWHEWSGNGSLDRFQCALATDHPSGFARLMDTGFGSIYKFNEDIATDDTTDVNVHPIPTVATTIKFDFGTMDRKFCHRFSVICDSPPAVLTPVSMSLEWSDDDYITWSTPRSIPITDELPSITQLGSFRRRAFRLTYAQDLPMRLDGVEIDFNVGIN